MRKLLLLLLLLLMMMMMMVLWVVFGWWMVILMIWSIYTTGSPLKSMFSFAQECALKCDLFNILALNTYPHSNPANIRTHWYLGCGPILNFSHWVYDILHNNSRKSLTLPWFFLLPLTHSRTARVTLKIIHPRACVLTRL